MREILFRAWIPQVRYKRQDALDKMVKDHCTKNDLRPFTHPTHIPKDKEYEKLYNDAMEFTMVESDEISSTGYMDYNVCVSNNGGYMDIESGWDYHGDIKDAILMQYTGLKDKNGKEIYEGDIVTGDWSIVDDIGAGSVEFYGGAFRFRPAGLPIEYGYYREECEIIGNIYENPELLTK